MEIINNVLADMRPEYWVALGAAVSILSLLVAGFSLIYARRSANASREQTKQQKQVATDAAQPRLWVDIRGDDVQGQALLLLGNSGPSIARSVKVTFDPAPPSTLEIKPILEILKRGIASLPPGRTMQWALGAAAHNADGGDAHKAYRVRIEAEGPFGSVEPLEYVISVDDLHGSPAAPVGNLQAVAAELHEMTKATKELNEIIRSASLEPA